MVERLNRIVDSVLVHLACHTNYHRLGGLNNKHLFLRVLKAEKLKIKALARLVSGVGLLPS